MGTCSIGRFDGVHSKRGNLLPLPDGIYNSIIINSSISSNCTIWNSGPISNYFIGRRVFILNTGVLSCSPDSHFGNGLEIAIGNETGGRTILSYADMTISAAYEIACNRTAVPSFKKFIDNYIETITIGYGIIEPDAVLINCPRISDSYICSGARCENITLLENATLLCSTEEPAHVRNGAYLSNSCLQWGCDVDSMAIVDNAVLTEYSHVKRHGKVTNAIIGPNTAIAEGEVTSSLIGPFIGFHHQSLLIGALWPEGKGNVAYGANVGSNHTSKAPDQEIVCGEGMFFGLGSNIKFPADFSCAPYSIIATGVTTLPQKMCFPFSLINTPSFSLETISPAINELLPGWVLTDNLYALKRNELKFQQRNKAHRSPSTFTIFRPDIVNLMLNARDRLRDITVVKDYYFDSDIPGIGKNFVTRQNIVRAVEIYSRHIEHYVLSGLLDQCTTRIGTGNDLNYSIILTASENTGLWEHQKSTGEKEGIFDCPIRDNLKRLLELISITEHEVRLSKAKDDTRGRNISDDYDSVHVTAENDIFIKEFISENNVIRDCIQESITHIAL